MNRIGIFTPTFARGGNEEYVIALARHVRARGLVPTVSLPNVEGVRSIRHDLAVSGIDTGSFPASPDLFFHHDQFLNTRDHAVRLMREQALDSAIISLPCVSFGGALIDAATICAVPTVVVYQLVERLVQASSGERQMHTWMRRQRQAWVTVSKQNRDRLCDSLGWGKDAVEVVHNGVLRATPKVDAEGLAAARVAVRSELGVPHDAHLVLTVARLDPQKAYDIALDAAAHVVQRNQNVHYVWLGDGGLEEHLRREIAVRSLEANIHLLGRRTDVDRFLLASDLFVLPSRFEGLPFAALEALQAGLPGVYSNIGPHAEIVRDGVEGLLVPVQDADSLAAAVERLIANPSLRTSISAAARERVKAFSADGHFAKIMELLERAGEHPERPNWPLPADTPRRRIAIYGASEGGRRAFKEAMPNDDVVAFLDRDRWRDDQPFLGRPVFEPSAATALDIDAVVIASCYHEQMTKTLTSAGYAGDRIEVFHPLRLVSADRTATTKTAGETPLLV